MKIESIKSVEDGKYLEIEIEGIDDVFTIKLDTKRYFGKEKFKERLKKKVNNRLRRLQRKNEIVDKDKMKEEILSLEGEEI